MKKIKGQFTGKVKINPDSKYYTNNNQLDKDIEKTKMYRDMFKHELETAIDMIYQRHVSHFRLYETAIDILQETLREKFIEYEGKK